MDKIRFTCTRLANTGKKGIITPNADGYYDLVIGGLNMYNSAGMKYTAVKDVLDLFQNKSSSFRRKIERGALRGEVGHPKFLPGMSKDQFIDRIMTIDEKNVCCHFSEVYLDFDSFKNEDGSPIITIKGLVKPSGAQGAFLKEQLENPKENVCFSIRSFSSKAVVGGVVQFRLVEVITWDRVTEPGLNIARKYFAPTLESYVDHEIKKEVLQEAVLKPTMVTENGMLVTHESKDLEGRALLRKLGWELNSSNLPASMRW